MFKEKYNTGKQLRKAVPRATHSEWKPSPDRPSVRDMIDASNHDRLPELIPVRHFRMAASPFAFYRATAPLMAYDLSATPSSGH